MSISNALFIVLICCTVFSTSPAAGQLVASFSASPAGGHAPLSVTFTDTSAGAPSGWAWYFGDGYPLALPWTEQNRSAWYGRFGHTSVALPDGSIVLMGGGGGYKNDVWRSSDQGITWTLQNTSAGWAGREFHTSVALPDGSIVLMGGYNGAYFKDVWKSADQGITWTMQTAAAPWAARAKHASVALPDGSIILMGGFNGTYQNDVWRSEDQGVTWTCISPHAHWSGRYGMTGVVLPGNRIAIIGGMYDSNGAKYSRDLWISADGGLTWLKQDYAVGGAPSPRCYHSGVALPDGSIVVTGGTTSGISYLNETVLFQEQGTSWYTRTYGLPGGEGRYHLSTVALPDGSIVLTGGQAPGVIKNDVWRLITANGTQNPLHMYEKAGNYSVTLQIHDRTSSNSTTHNAYITVSPELPAPELVGVVPDSAQNTGKVTITNLSGANFDTLNSPSVRLNRTGYPDVLACDVTVPSSSGITCTLDLTGQPPGPWNVVVENPDGKEGVLENGFTIIEPPPTASFSGTPTSGNTPLQVSFTDCSTGSPTQWYWDFGDGNSSSGQNPPHTYAIPGIYTVRLTVENTGGSDSMTKSGYITVRMPPPAIFSISPSTGENTTTSLLTHLSGANFHPSDPLEVKLNRTGSADIPATNVNTISGALIDCEFDLSGNAAGQWNVVVTNPDGQEGVLENGFTITQLPPVGGFFASPLSGKTPLLVKFTDTSTGAPSTWRWKFGDGGSSEEKNPSHTYVVAGTYTVVLTVQNSGGSDTLTRAGYIKVTAARPPVITSCTPAKMIHGKTTRVAILGNYFQNGAAATLVQGAVSLPVKITTLTPPSKIAGSVIIPASARGKYDLIVTNPDGEVGTRAKAITIT